MGRIPRLCLVLAALAVVVVAIPGQASGKGYRFGVAAGEVTSKSARMWSRAPDKGRGRVIVSLNKSLEPVAELHRVHAQPDNDLTVQKEVKGLEPGTVYYYRFCSRHGPCSDRGRFETAPPKNADVPINFAYTGDTDATPQSPGDPPYFGDFLAFKTIQDENNDFNIHLGDTIYSDSEVPGSPAALTVKQKWAHYRTNLEQPNLTNLRDSTGFYSHWDDHEFINDFSIPENGEQLYKRGVRAFRDYAPVSYTKNRGLYRTFRWGKNLELFFLDERSFRDAKASAGGVCDNPDTNAPDLAPTAPQPVRNAFAALIPSLVNPVTQACKDAINDPNRHFIGQAQLDRLINDLQASDATWKVIVNEDPIQQFYGLPYDRWEGYAYERIQFLHALESASIDNLAFITTDTHADFVNVVRERTLAGDVAPTNAPANPTDTPYQDFVTGPVATGTFWQEIDQTTGGSGSGSALSANFFKPAPPGGVGMACAQGGQFSYAEVTADSDALTIDYKTDAGFPVADIGPNNCGPYVLTP